MGDSRKLIRMPKTSHILKLREMGDPVLRQKAALVSTISGLKVQTLIQDMLTTVYDVEGLGLAAPQVGTSQRIFIIASHPNERYPYAPEIPPFAVINPQILAHSIDTEKDFEGCLSIPGLRGIVPRWREIEVTYQTQEGETKQEKMDGMVARIFQHELDHLDGILFVDRVESTHDLYTEHEFQNILKKRKARRI